MDGSVRMPKPRAHVWAGGRCQREIAGNRKTEPDLLAGERPYLNGVIEHGDPVEDNRLKSFFAELRQEVVRSQGALR